MIVFFHGSALTCTENVLPSHRGHGQRSHLKRKQRTYRRETTSGNIWCSEMVTSRYCFLAAVGTDERYLFCASELETAFTGNMGEFVELVFTVMPLFFLQIHGKSACLFLLVLHFTCTLRGTPLSVPSCFVLF